MNTTASSRELKPRNSQLELFRECLKRNVIIYMETGSGKTFIVSMVLKHYLPLWKSRELNQLKAVNNTDNNSKQQQQQQQPIRKLAFFLTNTVTLAQQQAQFLSETVQEPTGLYYGDLGVDFWDRQRWLHELSKYRLFVMTAQVFLDLIRHGYLERQAVGLLIFDECHHTRKLSTYQVIMDEVYHAPFQNSNGGVNCRPRVIGLTASPIHVSAKKSRSIDEGWVRASIQKLEEGMDAVVRTPFSFSDSPRKRPNEHIFLYSNDEMNSISSYLDQKLSHLFYATGELVNGRARIYKTRLEALSESSREKVGFAAYDSSFFTFLDIEYRFFMSLPVVVQSLGIGGLRLLMSRDLIEGEVVAALEPNAVNNPNFIERSTNVRAVLMIVEAIIMDVDAEYTNGSDNCVLSERHQVPSLVRILKQFLKGKKGQANNESEEEYCRGIIFVERRIIARLLALLLDEQFPGQCGAFVGQTASRHSSNVFLDTGVAVRRRENQKALFRFRSGDLTCLISTQVAEEGIDIQACNFVIRFNSPFSFVSYVQSRGRARSLENAHYYVMAPVNFKAEILENMELYHAFEELLSRILRSDNSASAASNAIIEDIEALDLEEVQNEESTTSTALMENSLLADDSGQVENNLVGSSSDRYVVPQTGAFVTRCSAISLLNRYISCLPGDAFFQVRPRFILFEDHDDLEDDDDNELPNVGDLNLSKKEESEDTHIFMESGFTTEKRFRYRLELPNNCPIRSIEGDWKSRKVLAKMDVCLKACIRLHKVEALTDFLLPDRDEWISSHKARKKKIRNENSTTKPQDEVKDDNDDDDDDEEGENDEDEINRLLAYDVSIGKSMLTLPTIPRPLDEPTRYKGELEEEATYYCYYLKVTHWKRGDENSPDILVSKDESFAMVAMLLEIPFKDLEPWIRNDLNDTHFFKVEIIPASECVKVSSDREAALKMTFLILSTMESALDHQELLKNKLPTRDLNYLLLPVAQEESGAYSIDWNLVKDIGENDGLTHDDAWSEIRPIYLSLDPVHTEGYLRDRVFIQKQVLTGKRRRYMSYQRCISDQRMRDHLPSFEGIGNAYRKTFADYLARSYRFDRPLDPDQPMFRGGEVPKPITFRELTTFKYKMRDNTKKNNESPSGGGGDKREPVNNPILIESVKSMTIHDSVSFGDMDAIYELKSRRREALKEGETEEEKNRKIASGIFSKLINSIVFFEALSMHPLPLSYFKSMQVLSIYLNDHVQDSLITQRFISDYELPADIPISIIKHALTSSEHNPEWNYQRLETLGDVVVKWAIAEYLFLEYPKKDEGFLTLIKSRWVSNDYLSKLAMDARLHEYALMEAHSNIWRPPGIKAEALNLMAQEKGVGKRKHKPLAYDLDGRPLRIFPVKLMADLVESVSGALYTWKWELGPSLDFLNRFVKFIPNPSRRERYREIYEADMYAHSPYPEFVADNSACLSQLEQVFQPHSIQNPVMWLEALTHVSDSTGLLSCYQRLEFLGDALIDLFVTRYLYESFGEHEPGTLTFLRASLVNSTVIGRLAYIKRLHCHLFYFSEAMVFSIAGIDRELRENEVDKVDDEIIDDKSKEDFDNRIEVDESTSEMQLSEEIKELDCKLFETCARIEEKCFPLEDPERWKALFIRPFPEAIKRQSSANNGELFSSIKHHIEQSWIQLLCAEQPPKVLCDIFESLSAALFIDSGLDMERVRHIILEMLDPILAYFGNPNLYVCRQPRTILLEMFQGYHCDAYKLAFVGNVRRLDVASWRGKVELLEKRVIEEYEREAVPSLDPDAEKNQYVKEDYPILIGHGTLAKQVKLYLTHMEHRIPANVPTTLGLCIWHGRLLSIGHGSNKVVCRKLAERLLVRQLLSLAPRVDLALPWNSLCGCIARRQASGAKFGVVGNDYDFGESDECDDDFDDDE